MVPEPEHPPAGGSPALSSTDRTRIRRTDRAVSDRAALNALLDEALIAHIGFEYQGSPMVIPMAFARINDDLVIHASVATRLARTLASGAPLCATVTVLDGLVLARSQFHHSMNYRSAMILGAAERIDDIDEATEALERIVEHLTPGRSQVARPPSRQEVRRTSVLRIPLAEASVKMRTGPPVDDEDDLAHPEWGSVWAGVIPLRVESGVPEPDPITAERAGGDA